MCRAVLENGQFDPSLCPLLQGLSAEEAVQAITQDPRIQACIAATKDDSMNAKSRQPPCAPDLAEERA